MKRLIATALVQAALLLCFGAHTAFAGAGDKIYVALVRDAGMAVVDPNSLDAWGSIKTGKSTTKMTVSPDRKFVYVAVFEENKVKCIDVSTDAVVKELEVSPGPYAMDITPDGKRLVVGTETSVHLIDTESFKEVGKLGLNALPENIRITPDGGTAYMVVGDPEAFLVALDIKGMKITKRIALPEQVYEMDMSPDGKTLYVSSTAASKIVIIDAAKMEATGQLDAYGEFGIALSRDGSELWVQGPEDMITVYSLKEKKVIARVPGAGGCRPRRMAFSPDGKLLFAWPAGEDCREIAVCNGALKKITGAIKLQEIPRFLQYIER